MFGGLAQACDIFNTTIIFEFCSQFFNSFLQLMNLYKNVPEVQLLILQFFADISRYAVSVLKWRFPCREMVDIILGIIPF
jgi:hypothetical protein